MSQIMFMNTTDSVVYPKPPPMGEPEPEPEDDDDFGNSMSLFNLMGGRNWILCDSNMRFKDYPTDIDILWHLRDFVLVIKSSSIPQNTLRTALVGVNVWEREGVRAQPSSSIPYIFLCQDAGYPPLHMFKMQAHKGSLCKKSLHVILFLRIPTKTF